MAASMMKQLFTNIVRRTQPFLRCFTVKNSEVSTRLFQYNIINNCRFQAATATESLGAIVSLGVLGFGISNTGDDKIEEAKSVEKVEETDKLKQLYRKARIAHGKQDLEEADKTYVETFKLAEEMHDKKEITDEKYLTAKTRCYEGMANIAFVQNRVEAAEALFEETLKGCLMQDIPKDHIDIIEISLKLASLYAMQKKKEAAEDGYKFCIAMLSPKLDDLEATWLAEEAANTSVTKENIAENPLLPIIKDTAVLLGTSVGSYGRFLMYEQRFPEALVCIERSKVFCKNTIGVDSNQYSVILNDLGTLYILTQKLDEAHRVLREGITLTKQYNLPEMAALHCTMGALQLRQGDCDTAAKTCRLAEELADKYDQALAKHNAKSCLKKIEEILQKKAKEEEQTANEDQKE